MDTPTRKRHWEEVYKTKPPETVGWYQPTPETSLALLSRLELPPGAPIIDIGGGDSYLTEQLLQAGFSDLTVLDISRAALERARIRLESQADSVRWVESDILDFEPERSYALWHDRATFHFLTEPSLINSYVAIALKGIRPGGYLILGTFSDKGPGMCSGLPVQRYSIAELQDVWAPHFEWVHGLNLDHHTPSGSRQAYTFGLFQRRD
jgi:SAM-dependent methyltransferase